MTPSTNVVPPLWPGRADLRPAGYELVRHLASGGMGEIWAAVRLGAQGALKPCVIKTIRPELDLDPHHRRSFDTEGRVGMLLGHSNLISVFDVGTIGSRRYMAMDWVDGVDLHRFWPRVQRARGGRPMAVDDAVHVVGALLDALSYLHEVRIAERGGGIVHHDISPRNVMISSRGEVKLMDFGLAGGAWGPGEMSDPCVRGTLRYLPREQVRGRPGPASDLFAVGAILHELLSGRKFRHRCTTDDALMDEILMGAIPALERRVPAPVESLRRGLLEPRAELRIKTARRALARLDAWTGHRNRRSALEGLYRRAFGRPRSGLTQLLAFGVHPQLLDELWRGVGQGSPVVSSESSRVVSRPWPDESGAVLEARVVEHAGVHRAALHLGRPGDADRADDAPAEAEITRRYLVPRRLFDGPDSLPTSRSCSTSSRGSKTAWS